MKKVGDFWVPDIDMSRFWRFGKNRRKTLRYYSKGGPKLDDLTEVLAMLPSGRLAIDGGANVGAYARILAGKYERVQSFEPSPDTYEALEQNVRDWGLDDRIETNRAALSDVCGTVGMKLEWGRRSLSRRVEGQGTITALSLDSLELDCVDFVKLDVEGAEFRALVGAKQTLLRCKPAVLFEDKPGKRDLDDADTDPHRYLKSLGAESRGAFGRGKFDWLYMFN